MLAHDTDILVKHSHLDFIFFSIAEGQLQVLCLCFAFFSIFEIYHCECN